MQNAYQIDDAASDVWLLYCAQPVQLSMAALPIYQPAADFSKY